MSDERPLLVAPPVGTFQGLAFERAGEAGLLVLAGKDADDAEAMRRELLERSLRGEVIELQIDTVSYGVGPSFRNRKRVDLSPAALSQFARSAPGTPFQRNHSLATQDTGGECMRASVQKDALGNRWLAESSRLSVPWAVQAALQGVMKAFSIQWDADPRRDAYCTSCEKPFLECDHYLGQEIELKDGMREVVGLVWRKAESVERSWVTYAAVAQSRVDAWAVLSQLKAARSLPSVKPKRGATNMDELLKLLKLGDSVGEQDVLAAVKSLQATSAGLAARLAAVEAERDDLRAAAADLEKLRAENAKLSGQLAGYKAAEQAAECEATVGKLLADARIRPGGKQEQLLRSLYAKGELESARETARSYEENPRIAPVRALQSTAVAEAGIPLAQGAGAGKERDWNALWQQLPQHIRDYNTRHASNPETFFRANPALLKSLGIQVS